MIKFILNLFKPKDLGKCVICGKQAIRKCNRIPCRVSLCQDELCRIIHVDHMHNIEKFAERMMEPQYV